MNRILIFYTSTILLLAWLSHINDSNIYSENQQSSAFYQLIEPIIERNYTQKSKGIFVLKLVTGIGPALHHSIKQPIADLYLYSLITFNALHFWLIINLFKLKKFKKLKLIIGLSAFCFTLKPIFFKSHLYNILKIYLKTNYIFYFTQIFFGLMAIICKIEFSYIFSAIFSNLFFSTRTLSRKKQIWHLIITQILISIALNKSISIIGIFISIIIIYLYIKFYPILFIIWIIGLVGKFSIVNLIIDNSLLLLKALSLFSNSFKYNSGFILLLIFIITSRFRTWWTILLISIFKINFAFTPIIHYSK